MFLISCASTRSIAARENHDTYLIAIIRATDSVNYSSCLESKSYQISRNVHTHHTLIAKPRVDVQNRRLDQNKNRLLSCFRCLIWSEFLLKALRFVSDIL